MAKWRVWGAVHATCYLGEYEAATKEEAEELAMESDAVQISVCHQCSDQVSDPTVDHAIAEMIE